MHDASLPVVMLARGPNSGEGTKRELKGVETGDSQGKHLYDW